MKTIMEGDDKYSKLELVDVVYGDDEPQKSTDQTAALLQNYKDLKLSAHLQQLVSQQQLNIFRITDLPAS